MTSNRWQEVERLYHAALERPESQRGAFLSSACGADAALRQEVESLLAQSDSRLRVLDSPALAVAAHLVSDPGMPSMIGRRIRTYDLVGLIGAGGMGEVYRARDSRLGREVAIKILPRAFKDDRERIARFEREAQVLASLNHPHIGAIYGLEDTDDVTALVMELVEGEDLSERLRRGALAIDDALKIARQIAEALEAAHEQDIIHRDLKPANIRVQRDGNVKVLDFGLAKPLSTAGKDTATITAISRYAGAIIGTPAYMSPEQARGELTGPETDIWAFGVVLYELLTGVSPFARPTIAETLARVLAGPPDDARLPVETPANVRRLIRRCLDKDPKRRWRHMGDVRIEIEEALAAPRVESTPGASEAAVAKPRRWFIAAAVAAIALAGWSIATVLYLRRPVNDAAVFHSIILPPGNLGVFRSPRFAVSPDGRRLAIVVPDQSRRTVLWIRQLDSPIANALSGTDAAEAPFWSPDSRSVAFVADGRLKRIDAAGGPVVTVAESVFPAPGAWSRQDVILFTKSEGSTLFQVPAAGGIPTAVTALDATAGESTHAHPSFLPDGRHFLYAAWSSTNAPLGIRLKSFDSGPARPLLDGVASAQYADSALLFVRETTLMTQGFDVAQQAFSGDAVPLANQISVGQIAFGSARAGAFSVSETGVLVYQTAPSAPLSRLVWLDRQGREIGTVGEAATYGDLLLSPDGQRVSVGVGNPGGDNRDVWVFDTVRGTGTRATFESGDENSAVWSPDGSRWAYSSTLDGRRGLYLKPASGAGDAVVVFKSDLNNTVPLTWSPDGEFLLYIAPSGPGGKYQMWTLPLSGDRMPGPFLQTPFNEGFAAKFSPDGRWISYPSDETGRSEVYIASFPVDPARKRRVSTAGGTTASWGQGGRELFYYEPGAGRLMSVALTYVAGNVNIGTPKPLFNVRRVPFWGLWYDVTRDGQRFLVNTPVDLDMTTPLTLVVNWRALVDR